MIKKTAIPELKAFLDEKFALYNQTDFISLDPISIPHAFTKQQDIEIAGFFAATLAWGQRVTIINKCKVLFDMMDNAPHDFIINHKESDLKPFLDFKHRTFNATDTLYFIDFFQRFYQQHNSLEEAFVVEELKPGERYMEQSLKQFHSHFFDHTNAPQRTRKHVATPIRKSACKRINMFLRWMVRDDNAGVDFGLWKKIAASDLICPCDVHVERVSRALGLIDRTKADWRTATELTDTLSLLDAEDPVKYDFALFGLGVMEGFGKVS
ncbi:MAG: hypothetical protein ACJAT1_001705 [Marivirga sp.]|jgi:uncharacterized protein (TIGR02757 family)